MHPDPRIRIWEEAEELCERVAAATGAPARVTATHHRRPCIEVSAKGGQRRRRLTLPQARGLLRKVRVEGTPA